MPEPIPNIHEIVPPRTLGTLTELIRRVLAHRFGTITILIDHGRIKSIIAAESYYTGNDKEETPTER